MFLFVLEFLRMLCCFAVWVCFLLFLQLASSWLESLLYSNARVDGRHCKNHSESDCHDDEFEELTKALLKISPLDSSNHRLQFVATPF
jgi:hypothetical protein